MAPSTLGLVSLAALGLRTAMAQNSSASLTDAINSANGSLSTLSTLLQGQTETLNQLGGASNITLLAPSNDALSDYLGNMSLTDIDPSDIAALLSYHVLNGTYMADNITDTAAFVPTLLTNEQYANVTGGQVVEAMKADDVVSFYSGLRKQSNVSQADIEFSGGVIHVIDQVLTIPFNLSTTAIESNLTAAAGALTAANLTDSLDTARDITVFVPTTSAFSDIASALQNISTQDLTAVLGYHVIEGQVLYSTDLENGTQTTLSGEDVNISVLDGSVYVDKAKVVQPDVLIANGVVHVIDIVLNPNATSNDTTPNTSTTAPAFSGASSLSDMPFTSGVPSPTGTQSTLPGNVASTTDSQQAGPRATAMVGMGALLGGAAVLANF